VALYDRIGDGYARTRQPDPRIAAALETALGDAVTVVNVGAGTGSYEPAGRRVTAVEPSAEMIAQRAAAAAPAVQGRAERLPFPDRSFDAATAILTVHHWEDVEAGLAELRRVAARVVVLTADPDQFERFWLVAEYLPGIGALDRAKFLPVARMRELLGGAAVMPVPIPHDCADGFLGAYWRRPEAYLDPDVRAGMSSFRLLDRDEVEAGLSRLADDLRGGAWHRRHGDLLDRDELDLGYRLLMA
jgi:hypothetical protein